MNYKVGDVINVSSHKHLIIQIVDNGFRTIDLDTILTYKFGECTKYPIISKIDKYQEVKDYLDNVTEVGTLLINIKKTLVPSYYKNGIEYYKVLGNDGEELDLLIVKKDMSISRYSLPINYVQEKFKVCNYKEFNEVYNSTKKLIMI